MQVDVNNVFNSAEDLVQYALGTMQVYSVVIQCKSSGMSCIGILALNHMEVIIKVLAHFSIELHQDLSPQDTLKIQVSPCE